MSLSVASDWFERRPLSDDVTRISEPHVHPFLRSNIWYVRGSRCDLVVDTGLGLKSVAEVLRSAGSKPIVAVATHTHVDHIGGMHEFEERLVHPLEVDALRRGSRISFDASDDSFPYRDSLVAAEKRSLMLRRLPDGAFEVTNHRIHPADPTRLVDEGDRINTGDREFLVFHLPGHSPGSIGLFESETGILFSGDAVYEGRLLDAMVGSSVDAYVATMRRLLQLSVRTVHAGHGDSFGVSRLHTIASSYISGAANR